ncbi:MAG: hypothetical protein ACR2G4_03635 [Pyrinomonadaceae bacterium]
MEVGLKERVALAAGSKRLGGFAAARELAHEGRAGGYVGEAKK